jgi:HSP20 family molecular chaperone IbpA
LPQVFAADKEYIMKGKIKTIEAQYNTVVVEVSTRSFTLPDNVDESKIEASYKDGMLYLTIPKTEKTKPKAIDVKIK